MSGSALSLLLLLIPVLAHAQRIGTAEAFPFGYIERFHSLVLGEDRTINIHLPQGYAADSVSAYPVIYLLDGSADEDLLHVAGALHFASFPWIQWMPPSVVVGIANVDRKRDFTSPTSVAEEKVQYPTTGGSEAFLNFIATELIPFIDSNYRSAPDRMLIGQSLGGLFATEVLLKRPELFQRYLIVSPSLYWDAGSVLELHTTFLNDPAKAPRQVFVAVGKEHPTMVKGAKRLVTLLRKNSAIHVGFQHLKDHDHANIMHRAVMDGFRWMGSR